jgi:chromosome segregation ATPase
MLKGVEALPKSLRDKLDGLSASEADDEQGVGWRSTAIEELAQKLSGVEDELLTTMAKAQEVVDGAEGDRRARVAAESAASAEFTRLKHALIDGKSTHKSSGKTVESALQSVDSAAVAQKKMEKTLAELRSKMDFLANVEIQTYAPLKSAPAGGVKGHKQLKTLCKIGKDNGFHEVLLSTLPVILKKKIDKRRTFDDLAIQQVDNEFVKLENKLVGEAADAETCLVRQTATLQTAQNASQAAQEGHENSAQLLAQTETALMQAKDILSESRKRVHRFQSDARQAERDLNDAKRALNAFRKGPLAALGELQTILMPEPADNAANADTNTLPSTHHSSSD